MNEYLVWGPSDGEDDARRIFAFDADAAAIKWAEETDQWESTYAIAQGQPMVVSVRQINGGPESRHLVRGDCSPTYYASAI